ncbi:MAG: hypothetical protein ACYC8T_26695 [Myxococcaceae bacterium]
MSQLNLILSLPQGAITATSLGIEGFAWHLSPGSAKYYRGRSVLIDLALAGGKPDFQFLPEGEWRDAGSDAAMAIAATTGGKRTKTALSNNAFSCTPINAYRNCYLMKTGGHSLALQQPQEIARYTTHECDENLTTEAVAKAIGVPGPATRHARLYMVLAPVEFLVLSNLSPAEYVWYATHRPGKKFRQVMFAELKPGVQLVAESVYNAAQKNLENPNKKTKTLVSGDCLNRVAFPDWVGYADKGGGIYVGDRTKAVAWRFPDVTSTWSRADG